MSCRYREVSLGEVCVFGDGAHTKVNRVETGIPYLTSKNIKDGYIDLDGADFISKEDYEKLFGRSQKSVRHLQEGDVLIGIIGTFGNCYLYKNTDRFGISSSIGIARPNQEVLNSMFLYHYLSSERFEKYTEMYKGGSVQGYTNLPTLRKIPIYLPPLEEQEKIANILSSLDDKIELNNEMNKTLEEMAQSIFKRWFVDFEFPNDDGEPYKSSGGEMVDSELGMIPKGWESKKISELIEIKDGTHASPKVAKEGYPLVTSKHIKGNRIFLEDAKLISEQDYIEVNKRSKVDTGDILISMIGTVGLTYLVQEEDINFAIKNIGLFKTSQKPLLSEYTYLYLKSKNMKNYIESRLAGTTQKYISLGELRKIAIILPNDSIMNKFKQVVGILLDKKRTSTIENEELTLIRDSILPKIMSGEIKLN